MEQLIAKIKHYLSFAGLIVLPAKKQNIIDEFHKLYYDSYLIGGTWTSNKFLGVATQKCPLDLFVYQEILYETKPDLIIEAGTANGGGALYLASICDLMGHGEVLTIDITDLGNLPVHKRISYLFGSSTSEEIIKKVEERIQGKNRVMVILDSDHSKNHVLQELRLYHRYVTSGCYLIVEDTNVNSHPVRPEHGPGPAEALSEFFDENSDFIVDREREKAYCPR